MAFSAFETSVLAKFAELYGGQSPGLATQLQVAQFARRENTGSGFFTDISVDRATPPVSCTSPLDGPSVVFDGMAEGLELLLFLRDGYICLLEGYSIAGEDTSSTDLASLPVLPMHLRHPILNDIND
jgi:hypothetical protein